MHWVAVQGQNIAEPDCGLGFSCAFQYWHCADLFMALETSEPLQHLLGDALLVQDIGSKKGTSRWERLQHNTHKPHPLASQPPTPPPNQQLCKQLLCCNKKAGIGNGCKGNWGGMFARRAPGALLLDYVPPEEPPSTPLGNALRIR